MAASVVMLSATLAGSTAEAAPRPPRPPRFQPCPEPFPVAEVTEGTRGTGLTVERGTTPDRFTATTVGVIDDGIGPDIDLILMEVDSPALQRAGGVWAGMSGSPVYADDGRLIGAVSYALGVPSPVAGVTPAAAMRRLLDRPGPVPEPAESVALPASLREEVVDSGAASTAEAAAGMQRLPVPLGVSGLSQARLDRAAGWLEDELPGVRVHTAGAAPVGPPGSQSQIAPGGNFAAAISYGDVTAAAMGTTTAVCEVGDRDVALAFGHPFQQLGTTSLTAHPATALYIQPDNVYGPTKFANPGAAVGTVDEDRLAGLRGLLGPTPPAIAVTSTITSTDAGISRVGTTQVNLQQYLPALASEHLVANIDRIADRVGGGTSELRWVVTGAWGSGEPFTVDVTNRYADPDDITVRTGDDLVMALNALDDNRFEDARITGVDVTGSVSSTYTRYDLDELQVRQPDGSYAPASPTVPLLVEPGSELALRLVLVPYRNPAGARTVDLTLEVPDDAAGAVGSVQVTGGPSLGPPPAQPGSFDELLDQLGGQATNDSVTASLSLDSDPLTPVDSARAVVDQVVVGELGFPVLVLPPPEEEPGDPATSD